MSPLIFVCVSVGILLAHLDGLPASLIPQEMPKAMAARTGKQPLLSVAAFPLVA
jgi:hypothetical protein